MAHAMNFQLNLSNGSGHAAEKSPCSPCKVLLIINQLKTKTIAFVEHVCDVRGIKFQENPSNGNRDMAGNLICSSSKKPSFFTKRKKLQRL